MTNKAIFLLQPPTSEKLSLIAGWGAQGIFLPHRFINDQVAGWVRKLGLSLYAEMTIFAGEDLWRRYPDSRPRDRKGRIYLKGERRQRQLDGC